MSKPQPPTQKHIVEIWERLRVAQLHMVNALEHAEKEDCRSIDDEIAAAEGQIELTSALLQNLRLNHTR